MFRLLLDSRQRRSTINLSTLKFIIGEDATCPSLNTDVYCNGPLTAGTSYMYDLFTPTNKTTCIYLVHVQKWVFRWWPPKHVFWKTLNMESRSNVLNNDTWFYILINSYIFILKKGSIEFIICELTSFNKTSKFALKVCNKQNTCYLFISFYFFFLS